MLLMEDVTPSPFAMALGQRIKNLRQSRGMKQKALADMLGYKSHSAIFNIEAGKQVPNLELACGIAKVLGVTLADLIGETDDYIALQSMESGCREQAVMVQALLETETKVNDILASLQQAKASLGKRQNN